MTPFDGLPIVEIVFTTVPNEIVPWVLGVNQDVMITEIFETGDLSVLGWLKTSTESRVVGIDF